MSKIGTKESALREARQTNLNEKDKAAIAEIKGAAEAKAKEKEKAKAAEKKENKKIREKLKAAAKAAKETGKAQAVTNGSDVTVVVPQTKHVGSTKTVVHPKLKDKESSGRKGAFNDKVVEALVPMVKKGCTVGQLIAAGRKAGWGAAANPVKRAHRFIKTVANGDLKMKAKITGDGEDAKIAC